MGSRRQRDRAGQGSAPSPGFLCTEIMPNTTMPLVCIAQATSTTP